MYQIRRMTNLSLKEIGKEFEGRDHTTVMHSIDRIEKLTKTNPEIAEGHQGHQRQHQRPLRIIDRSVHISTVFCEDVDNPVEKPIPSSSSVERRQKHPHPCGSGSPSPNGFRRFSTSFSPTAYYYDLILPFSEVHDQMRTRSPIMKFSCEKALLQAAISTASQSSIPKAPFPLWRAFCWRRQRPPPHRLQPGDRHPHHCLPTNPGGGHSWCWALACLRWNPASCTDDMVSFQSKNYIGKHQVW